MKWQTRTRRVFVAATLFLAVIGLWAHDGADAEDELKRATLLAFIQNSHWTEPLAGSAPLVIGVLGRPAFAHYLRVGIEGKSVDGHPLRIQEVRGPDVHCCRVLYFATDRPDEIKPALQTLNSDHVLTIGETERFLEHGGAVNLFLLDGHMAFEVSLGALERSGVEISSRLLRFGQIRDLAKGRSGK